MVADMQQPVTVLLHGQLNLAPALSLKDDQQLYSSGLQAARTATPALSLETCSALVLAETLPSFTMAPKTSAILLIALLAIMTTQCIVVDANPAGAAVNRKLTQIWQCGRANQCPVGKVCCNQLCAISCGRASADGGASDDGGTPPDSGT